MLKIILSSGIAATISFSIAFQGVVSDGMRITGAVLMYYLFWGLTYAALDRIEERRGGKRSESSGFRWKRNVDIRKKGEFKNEIT